MNQQEKIAYLNEHLRYEVIMMRWSFEKIPTVFPSLERNAFIECFAIHARALYEFLLSMDDRGSRNVVTRDYVDGFKPKRNANISHKITKLNQHILHTGTTRTDKPELKFNTDDGAKCLNGSSRLWMTS